LAHRKSFDLQSRLFMSLTATEWFNGIGSQRIETRRTRIGPDDAKATFAAWNIALRCDNALTGMTFSRRTPCVRGFEPDVCGQH
jgi:hypothetical protein